MIRLPIALTVAGSDSGGGAGVQADLKVFQALGVHGTSVITCLTAQNPRTVAGVHATPAAFVRLQLETLYSELPPSAAKTGMLFSRGIISTVCRFWRLHPRTPLVVDPVMISTSRFRLLKPSAERLLQDQLLPRAMLVTPNVDEAEFLLGMRLRSEDDLAEAARRLHARWGCAALVKGGHLRRSREAVDVFFDGHSERRLRSLFVRGVSTHGTGCTYSAAITAGLAAGRPLIQAVELAKDYIAAAIGNSVRIGRHSALQVPARSAL